MTTQADVAGYAAEIAAHPRTNGWCLKDSYACLDLAALGFSMLFQAEWIWRDAAPPMAGPSDARLSWVKVCTPAGLAAWEQAWSGGAGSEAQAPRTRQFPVGLLGSADHAFFAGLLEGKVVAGGIANRSPGVVGLSNVFSPPEFLDATWAALVNALAAAFPGAPIAGFERGADLGAAKGAGFAAVGDLRLWCRPA